MMESRLLEIHPHVPLMGRLGLGIALFSCDGTPSWGFSADWDQVPDLHDLVLATEQSFDELRNPLPASADGGSQRRRSDGVSFDERPVLPGAFCSSAVRTRRALPCVDRTVSEAR